MDLRTYRKQVRGLTLEDAARELECSVGHLSGVEASPSTLAGLELALRIEAWSKRKVSAESLNPRVAELRKLARAS